MNIGNKFIDQLENDNGLEIDTLVYKNNVFEGTPTKFGKLGYKESNTLDDWKEYLKSKKVFVSDTGIVTKDEQVKDAKKLDFRLRKESMCIDKANKVFVPWGLYAVVGEWGFYKCNKPDTVLGEHVYWTKERKERNKYNQLPRNNLTGYNIDESNYKQGILEDWVEGAIELNGENEYLELKDNPIHSADMNENNFLIEAIVNAKKGPIVSKLEHSHSESQKDEESQKGYLLEITEQGKIKMTLFTDKGEYSQESENIINDGKWHHIIAEIDRKSNGINIYIDGKKSVGANLFAQQIQGSLSNKGNLYIGKKENLVPKIGTVPEWGLSLFSGMIDFIRISRGTLADAETTIEELYNWEFNGPFLKDFYDKPAKGKARDIGAIEYVE
jgi:hypothetical protein